MKTILSILTLAALCSCSKAVDAIIDNATTAPANPGTVSYTIASGAHYCDQNGIRAVDLATQRFTVRFDESARYTTTDPANQYDINKLWGFSDNNNPDHHQYSARFGWRWSDGALRLFGYVYNAGVVSSKEIGTVSLHADHQCSIDVKATQYYFTLDGQTDSIPRTATTPTGKGYQLYPYFGGDEVAPHKVTILIREN
jgi:hypothetical protein